MKDNKATEKDFLPQNQNNIPTYEAIPITTQQNQRFQPQSMANHENNQPRVFVGQTSPDIGYQNIAFQQGQNPLYNQPQTQSPYQNNIAYPIVAYPNNLNNQFDNRNAGDRFEFPNQQNQRRENQLNTDVNNLTNNQEVFNFKDKNIRLNFIKKVYSILAVQFLITFAMVLASFLSDNFKTFQRNNVWLFILSACLTFVIAIVLGCFVSVARKVPINYILLFLFTICESYIVSYATSRTDPDTVLLAAGLTCAIVLALTLYAIFTRTDFTTMGGILLVCLIGLIIGGIVAYFFRNKWLNLVLAVLSVIIFGIYLVFDTQLIVGNQKNKFQIDDYIFGAINLYLDIVMIFLNILSILGTVNN